MENILEKFCYCQIIDSKDVIFLDYPLLKSGVQQFNSNVPNEIYIAITQKILSSIDTILATETQFSMHVFLKGIAIKDIHTHHKFIIQLTSLLKTRYPERLKICYIYHAPFIFQQIYNIISPYLDSPTRKKIVVMENKNSDNHEFIQAVSV